MEVNKFLNTVSISSNLSVHQLGLKIPRLDLPSLLIVQQERVKWVEMNNTFMESFSKFNDNHKKVLEYYYGIVVPNLTKTSIQIKNDDVKMQGNEGI